MTLDRPFLRARILLALSAVLTAACGLGLRHIRDPLPHVVWKEGGDLLSATLIYFLARILWPAPERRARAALATVVFCFAVETLQLYQAPWILRIRATTLGGLCLGHGFHAADLVAYVLGVALGLLLERAACAMATSGPFSRGILARRR